jgi:hypothetical protein
MKTKYTEAQLQQISAIQERDNITRKAAVKKFSRLLKANQVHDFKAAAANDDTPTAPVVRRKPKKVKEAPVAKAPARNASLVAKGAAYHQLACKPTKQAVVTCFGKSGYALSWVNRADKLGITPQELCEQFRTNPAQVADRWATLASEEAKPSKKGAVA